MSTKSLAVSDLFVVAVPAAYAVDESGTVVGYTPVPDGEAVEQVARVYARIEEMNAPRVHAPAVVAPAPKARTWAFRNIAAREFNPEREFVIDEA